MGKKVNKLKKESKIKLPNWDKLYKKAYGLWRDCCILRDGKQCMVQKMFSQYSGMIHGDIIQVDHCFARANKWLHLDVSNGTVVCNNCNGGKKWQSTPAGALIDEIVKRREGEEIYERMRRLFANKEPNVNWKKTWWMQEQIDRLEKIKKTLEERK